MTQNFNNSSPISQIKNIYLKTELNSKIKKINEKSEQTSNHRNQQLQNQYTKTPLIGKFKVETKNNYKNIKPLFFNGVFDKGRIKLLVSWSLQNCGGKLTIDLIENLKNLGFGYATKAGISLGIDDLRIPLTKNKLISDAEINIKKTYISYKKEDLTGLEKFQHLIDTWHRTSEILKQHVIAHFKQTDILNPVYMMAFSGARGNVSQVRQLVGMRGLMSDPQGQILDFPIKSNFREGITLTEYIISCYGARKGLVDTALKTANSGYLTRRLVDVSHHIIVSDFDCKTKRGITLTDIFENKKVIVALKNRLVGRVLAENIYCKNFLHEKHKNFKFTQKLKYNVKLNSHLINSVKTEKNAYLINNLNTDVNYRRVHDIITVKKIQELHTNIMENTKQVKLSLFFYLITQLELSKENFLNSNVPDNEINNLLPENNNKLNYESSFYSNSFSNIPQQVYTILDAKEFFFFLTYVTCYTIKKNLIVKKNKEISSELAIKIAALRKVVLVRSPLTCEIKNSICQLCYGWSLARGKLVCLGEAVGVLAAQSIGEPGTQLTMRTFHTGGVFSGDIMSEILAPFDGTILFSNFLQGMLIRTPHGRITFLTKIQGSFQIKKFLHDKLKFDSVTVETDLYQESVCEEKSVTDLVETKTITLQIPALTVLFVRNGEFIHKGQVIAEFSSMSTDANQRITASKDVKSEIDGELYFKKLLLYKFLKKNEVRSRTSCSLGSIWIFSGKICMKATAINLFVQPGDLVDDNSIIAQYETMSRYNNFIKSDFCLKKNKINLIQQKSDLSTSLLSIHCKKLNLNNENQFYYPLICYSIQHVEYKKLGYLFSFFKSKKHKIISATVKQSILHNHRVFFSSCIKKNFLHSNNISKKFFFQSFPTQYQTKTGGTLIYDNFYLNKNTHSGEVFWIAQQTYLVNAENSYINLINYLIKNFSKFYSINMCLHDSVTVKKIESSHFKLISEKSYTQPKINILSKKYKLQKNNAKFTINNNVINFSYNIQGKFSVISPELTGYTKYSFLSYFLYNKKKHRIVNICKTYDTMYQIPERTSLNLKKTYTKNNFLKNYCNNKIYSFHYKFNQINFYLNPSIIICYKYKRDLTIKSAINKKKLFIIFENVNQTILNYPVLHNKKIKILQKFHKFFTIYKAKSTCKQLDIDFIGYCKSRILQFLKQLLSIEKITSLCLKKNTKLFIKQKFSLLKSQFPWKKFTNKNLINQENIKFSKLNVLHESEKLLSIELTNQKIDNLAVFNAPLSFDRYFFYNEQQKKIVNHSLICFFNQLKNTHIINTKHKKKQQSNINTQKIAKHNKLNTKYFNQQLIKVKIKPGWFYLQHTKNLVVNKEFHKFIKKDKKIIKAGEICFTNILFDQCGVYYQCLYSNQIYTQNKKSFTMKNKILENQLQFAEIFEKFSMRLVNNSEFIYYARPALLQTHLKIHKILISEKILTDLFYLYFHNNVFINNNFTVSELLQHYISTINHLHIKTQQKNFHVIYKKIILKNIIRKNYFSNKKNTSKIYFLKNKNFTISKKFTFINTQIKNILNNLFFTINQISGCTHILNQNTHLQSVNISEIKKYTLSWNLPYHFSHLKLKTYKNSKLLILFSKVKCYSFNNLTQYKKLLSQKNETLPTKDTYFTDTVISTKKILLAKNKLNFNGKLFHNKVDSNFKNSINNTQHVSKTKLSLSSIKPYISYPMFNFTTNANKTIVENVAGKFKKTINSNIKYNVTLQKAIYMRLWSNNKQNVNTLFSSFLAPDFYVKFSFKYKNFKKVSFYKTTSIFIYYIVFIISKNYQENMKTISFVSKRKQFNFPVQKTKSIFLNKTTKINLNLHLFFNLCILMQPDLDFNNTLSHHIVNSSKDTLITRQFLKYQKNALEKTYKFQNNFLTSFETKHLNKNNHKIQKPLHLNTNFKDETAKHVKKSQLFFCLQNSIQPETPLSYTNLLSLAQGEILNTDYFSKNETELRSIFKFELPEKFKNKILDFPTKQIEKQSYLTLTSNDIVNFYINHVNSTPTKLHESSSINLKSFKKTYDNKNINNTSSLFLGRKIRYGTKINFICNNNVSNQPENRNVVIPLSGVIIQIEKLKITIRKAQPILFSSKGLVSVYEGYIIEKNTLVLRLFYQRLKTGDIVQGIPRIEQLFEARKTNQGELLSGSLHQQLEKIFLYYFHKYDFTKAARYSLEKIQQIIVSSVQKVYRSQGVTIADKHLEIIIRQMTSKVEIIQGGHTNLLFGEIIDLDWIEAVNETIQPLHGKAIYVPIILGITRKSLETKSFISEASFQETTRVLAKSAIEKRTDFLKGLKENVILGKLVPAGTGFYASTALHKKFFD